ncbi:DUF1992 domain-containing protein [Bacillus lacus]|uniref:DUF1992 domain-containing protein n=1 Tax=Metabacillus lacus TaxID=1983721 RepID=A0A7X2M0N6_9BACI|nr:DUF1992 domain-containing protein [Metabacillus lacus]MRX73387.1 DUF1992 domain-containing protein [Metabacillus lacus]
MDFFTILSEDKIKRAIGDGEFQQIPGMGKPLQLEDLSHIPENLRMAYKMMKNGGMIEEGELKKQIKTLEDLLVVCGEEDKAGIESQLSERKYKLDHLFKKRNALTSPASAYYKEKVYSKLT